MFLAAEDRWERTYKSCKIEDIPWFYADLDPDIEYELLIRQLSKGNLLEVGSGPGTQAIELAKRGFLVTATDISHTAVAKARQRASKEGVHVHFIQGDVTKDSLPGHYDYILDRACLHCLQPNEWQAYYKNIMRVLRPGGIFILKCFGGNTPSSWTSTSHYFTEEDIYGLFSKDFTIESIQRTVYYSSYDPLPSAFFIILTKRQI